MPARLATRLVVSPASPSASIMRVVASTITSTVARDRDWMGAFLGDFGLLAAISNASEIRVENLSFCSQIVLVRQPRRNPDEPESNFAMAHWPARRIDHRASSDDRLRRYRLL